MLPVPTTMSTVGLETDCMCTFSKAEIFALSLSQISVRMRFIPFILLTTSSQVSQQKSDLQELLHATRLGDERMVPLR